eukprot:COSAG02_NODE_3215_length_7161_cov_57.637638_5_plen_447_part_00
MVAGTEHALNALIGTILTQNTSDILSSRSFSQLHRHFDSGIHGPEIRAADIDEIADLLAASGLQNSKARRIRQLLRLLHDENGSVSLEALKSSSREQIHRHLSRFSGIGVKTIACIGLYNLGAQDFAIDTHIYRFAVRFGWVPTFTFAETLSATPTAIQTSLASAHVSPPPVLRLPMPPTEPPLHPASEARAARSLAKLLADPQVSSTTGLVGISSTSAAAAASSAVVQPCEIPSNATACDGVELTDDTAGETVDYDSDATEEMDELDARIRAFVEVDDDEIRSSAVSGYTTTGEEQHTSGATMEQLEEPTGGQSTHFVTAGEDSSSAPATDISSLVNSRSSDLSAPAHSQPAVSNANSSAASCLGGDIEDLAAQSRSVHSDRSAPARFMRIPPITDVQTHILKRFEVRDDNYEVCYSTTAPWLRRMHREQAENLDQAALFELVNI